MDVEAPENVEKVAKSRDKASRVELGNSSFLKLERFSNEADIFK